MRFRVLPGSPLDRREYALNTTGRDERTALGGPRRHERPRRPSSWSTRASKGCLGTRSRGILAFPEGRTFRMWCDIRTSPWGCQVASQPDCEEGQIRPSWQGDKGDPPLAFFLMIPPCSLERRLDPGHLGHPSHTTSGQVRSPVTFHGEQCLTPPGPGASLPSL